MKPWTDLSTVPVPGCLSARPKDPRGYPIPYNVARRPDGTYDFRVICEDTWLECVKRRLCGLSGLPLGESFVVVSGPLSARSGFYTDLPMIPEAAEYALRVCPFIAAPKYGYSAVQAVPGMSLKEIPDASTKRPHMFVAVTATKVSPVVYRGNALLQVAGATAVEFWRHGQRYTPTEQDQIDDPAVRFMVHSQKELAR